MDSVVVVVMQLQGNGFVQVWKVWELGESTQVILEFAKEAFHEAVLPGAGFVAHRQDYLQLFAQQLVFGTQIL
jgi:hypothetical protein